MKNFQYLIPLIGILVLSALYLKNSNQEGFSSSCPSETTTVYDLHCNPGKCRQADCYPAKAGSVEKGTAGPGCNYPTAQKVAQVTGSCPEGTMKAYHLSNEVYYPRYKFWWRWIKDLKTRPPYNRVFTPFWNTWQDPNITSEEYYQRVAADNIMPEGKNTCQIKQAHEENFGLRQAIKFQDRAVQ